MRRAFVAKDDGARSFAIGLPLHEQADLGFQCRNLIPLNGDDLRQLVHHLFEMRDLFLKGLHMLPLAQSAPSGKRHVSSSW